MTLALAGPPYRVAVPTSEGLGVPWHDGTGSCQERAPAKSANGMAVYTMVSSIGPVSTQSTKNTALVARRASTKMRTKSSYAAMSRKEP